MALPIVAGLVGLFKMGGQLFANWQQKKLIQAEGKIRLEQAKAEGRIRLEERKAEGDIAYDVQAQRGMVESWKDEWLTIVLSAVFIACFIPGLQGYVKEGFAFLKTNTPWWFEWSFTGMIAASFGLRGWKLYKNGNGNGGK